MNETVTGLTVTQKNDVVHISVNESDGDFLKNLKSITLTKDGKEDTVWAKGVEGSDAVYYVLAADYKSVDLYNVTTPGDYTVKIQANYYGENGLSAEFTVTGEVELTPVPDMTIVTSETGGVYRVEFHEKTNAATANEIGSWKLAVKKITVNGVEYSECGFPSAPKASTAEYSWTYSQGSEKVLLLGGSAFKDGDNKIIIQATGYQDLQYTIGDSSENPGDEDSTKLNPPTVAGITFEKAQWAFDDDVYVMSFTNTGSVKIGDYLGEVGKKTGKITINGTECSFYSGYTFGSDDGGTSGNSTIKFKSGQFSSDGKYTIVISTDGYKDLRVVAMKNSNTFVINDSEE